VSARRLRFTVCATQRKTPRKRESDFVTHASPRRNFLNRIYRIFLAITRQGFALSPDCLLEFYRSAGFQPAPGWVLEICANWPCLFMDRTSSTIPRAYSHQINLLTMPQIGRDL